MAEHRGSAGNPVAYAQGLYKARKQGIPSLTPKTCIKGLYEARQQGIPTLTVKTCIKGLYRCPGGPITWFNPA